MLALSIRFGSGMIAPSIPSLMKQYNPQNDPDTVSDDKPLKLDVFVVSVYVLGFAAGPLLMAPLSHIYGRRLVNFATGIGFWGFTVLCAVTQSLGVLIFARFLAGVCGCGALTNGPGSIVDLWSEQKRKTARRVYSSSNMLGLVFGPLAGGYMVDGMGWSKSLYIYAAVVIGLNTAVVLSGETYAPALLQRKVDSLRVKAGNTSLLSWPDIDKIPPGKVF